MNFVDLLVAAAVVAAVVFSLMRDPAELAVPAHRARLPHPRRTRWTAGAALVGRLMLVQRLGPRTLGLDCLLKPASRPARASSPVHVRARCAVTWWAADRFMHLVELWAAGNDPVAVEIVPYEGRLRAKVCHAESCLILDVVNADDLARAAVELQAA